MSKKRSARTASNSQPLVTWRWYQRQIADFFRRMPDARVEEDVFLPGRTGTRRQIDVNIHLPLRIRFPRGIEVPLDLHIIGDAKQHSRPISVDRVDAVGGLRDDVGANIAVIASPHGFTQTAEQRARTINLFLLRVTSDLLGMMREFEFPADQQCLAACDAIRGVVSWRLDSHREGMVLKGYCEECSTLHLSCPDCGITFGITDVEVDVPLRCPGLCGRLYRVESDREAPFSHEVQMFDALDVSLLSAAASRVSKRLKHTTVRKLIDATKWKYFRHEIGPECNLTEYGFMEWDDEGDFLRLTEEGQEVVNEWIEGAADPTLSPLPWNLPTFIANASLED